jgi:hypothetical protein
MRFYDITITPPLEEPKRFNAFSFSSQSGFGLDNYSCLKVDLDIYQNAYHQYASNGYVRVFGINLKDLGQIGNYNPVITPDGKKIQLCGIIIQVGMSKGLPYANPRQRGIILQGSILQAFANWQGTEVTLDLVIVPGYVDSNSLRNIPLTLKKDQELTVAVKQALRTAYPTTNINGSFSDGLKYTEDTQAQNFDLLTLSSTVNQISKSIKKDPTYTGAVITSNAEGFFLTDSAITPTATRQIAFTDVIGNLTWLGINTIQAKVVMRGDLNIGDYISFESGIPVLNIVNNSSQYRNKISFNGVFFITKLHHTGSSRQADGNAWVTIIEAIIPNLPISQT